MISLPSLRRGRPSKSASAAHDRDVREFCDHLLEINSRLDFQVSARGWCYLLEEHGLGKGDFDDAEKLITECRKQRLLPMHICAEDGARSFDYLERDPDGDPAEFAEGIVNSIQDDHEYYMPFSFWDDKDVYLQMVVEKIDLKSLFSPICEEFRIPIANARGWSDLNLRWSLLQRIRAHAAEGRRCVILYCGDHDPAGLNISDSLRKNLAELLTHREWLDIVDLLEIDRFGLNADFIAEHSLTWIENLQTGSGKSLADPKHKDHRCDYVQRYLKRFGVRKCEANALVVRPQAGRNLCRQTILKYLPADAPAQYEAELESHRGEARAAIVQRLQEMVATWGAP
jgi:hypothetical protein